MYVEFIKYIFSIIHRKNTFLFLEDGMVKYINKFLLVSIHFVFWNILGQMYYPIIGGYYLLTFY